MAEASPAPAPALTPAEGTAPAGAASTLAGIAALPLEQVHLLREASFLDRFRELRHLRRGRFCTVVRLLRDDADRVAVKSVRSTDGREMHKLWHECRMLQNCHAAAVASGLPPPGAAALELFIGDEQSRLVLELAASDLSLYCRSAIWAEDVAANFARQLTEVVCHLHICGVAHLALAPSNVLLFRESPPMATLRLCDFGNAAEVGSNGTELVGDMAYRAPEVWARAYSCRAADVFSLGLLLAELLGWSARDAQA
jgi:serine/threonine protein kinase